MKMRDLTKEELLSLLASLQKKLSPFVRTDMPKEEIKRQKGLDKVFGPSFASAEFKPISYIEKFNNVFDNLIDSIKNDRF
jgi:hypothetical protein